MGRKTYWFVFLILLNAVQKVNLLEDTCINSGDNIRNLICFIFIGLLTSIILFNITKHFNLPFPYRIVVTTLGAVFGVVAKFNHPLDDNIDNSIIMEPTVLFTIMVPIITYRIGFNMDIHAFARAWLQILILAGPGFILNTCFTGLLLMLLMPKFSVVMAICIGSIITPIYPIEIIELLNGVGHFKSLTALLQGEAIIGEGTAIILYTLFVYVVRGTITKWYDICLKFLYYGVGGIIVGFLCSAILTFLMRFIHNDPVNMAMLTLTWSFITSIIARNHIGVSNITAVAILGLKMGMEKASMSPETEKFLTNFWDLLAYCVDTIICSLSGFLLVHLFSVDNIFKTNGLAFVIYILSVIGRLFSYILLSPIISRLGYGLTFKEMVIAVWSGLKGPLALVLGLAVCYPPSVFRRDILFYISGLMVLTLLINASSMPYVLKILGVSEVSVVRKINMNNCMRHLQNRKERTIATLKMDRFLSDANWPVVNEVTEIPHPYRINYSLTDDESDIFLFNRSIVCPDCKKDVLYKPSEKEMVAMLREARLRILKAKKMSYTRQYQSGTLSKDGIRILLQAVEVAMDRPDALIVLDGLHKYFKTQGFLEYARRKLLTQFFKKTDTPSNLPRKYYRRVCYNIVTNITFKLALYLCIILHTVSTCCELSSPPDRNTTFFVFIVLTNMVLFLVFLAEFVLKVLAFSWVFVCSHGFKAYFGSYWNIFDFACLMVNLVDVLFIIFDLLLPNYDKYHSTPYTIVQIAKICRTIRLIRILTLCVGLYSKLILYCDSKIDEHSAFAYDIGKGVVSGEEEVASILTHMVDNDIIREICRSRVDDDRLSVTKELGIIQKNKPWIAITVKTRQAARSTLKSMQEAVQELKLSGVADDFEYMKLMQSIELSFKRIRTQLKSVQPCSPKELFKEVSWISGNEKICDFLYNNVFTRVFDPGDRVCVDGEPSDNIYILITGIFKLSYVPKAYVTDRLYVYGALPVIDYIKSPRFEEKFQDYILSGNSIGELSVLTNRPYNCTIIAESASQVYGISNKIIKSAFLNDKDTLHGLEARMWKTISMRLATTILMETTAYQSKTLEEIKYILERAFVLNLKNYKVFYVNDLIEDVLLIEGVIWDWNTKLRYTAPCYIPRTVQRIVFPKSMNFATTVETKILIVPAKDVVEFDIKEKLDVSEMVNVSSSRCLHHTVQNNITRKKRSLGPQEYYRRSKVNNRGHNSKDLLNNECSSPGKTSFLNEILSDTSKGDQTPSHLKGNWRLSQDRDYKLQNRTRSIPLVQHVNRDFKKTVSEILRRSEQKSKLGPEISSSSLSSESSPVINEFTTNVVKKSRSKPKHNPIKPKLTETLSKSSKENSLQTFDDSEIEIANTDFNSVRKFDENGSK